MSEIGTIGQTYENRKSGKIGTLVERDEKYKTLLMESPNGGTFNISYASLKSNWRKADSSIAIKKSQESELQESSDEVLVDEPDTKSEPINEDVSETTKVVKFKRTRKVSNINLYDNSLLLSGNFLVSVNSPHFSLVGLKNKYGIAFKIGKSRVFEIYSRANSDAYVLFMKDSMFGKVVWDECLNITPANVTYNAEFILNSYFSISSDSLQNALDSIKPVIESMIKEYAPKVIKTLEERED